MFYSENREIFQNIATLKGRNWSLVVNEDRVQYEISLKNVKEAKSKNLSATIKWPKLIDNMYISYSGYLEKNQPK